MHIIKPQTLKECWERHPDSKIPLQAWLKVAESSKWKNVNEIKQTFPNVSVLSNNRVVFNIKGNDYRLIVAFRFEANLGYICFVGTHDEYSKIDANTIWLY